MRRQRTSTGLFVPLQTRLDFVGSEENQRENTIRETNSTDIARRNTTDVAATTQPQQMRQNE